MSGRIVGVSSVRTLNYTSFAHIIWVTSFCTFSFGHASPRMIICISSSSIDCNIILTLISNQKACIIGLFTPTALWTNFYALSGFNFESIIVYWVDSVLCTDRDTTSWTKEISIFSSWTYVIAIGLGGISNIITESFRVWADISAEVSTGRVVLEVLDTWVRKTVRGTQMRHRVTPVICSHTFLNTPITLSKQRNQPSIRTGGNALHVPIILELSSRTGTVTCPVCCVKVRLSRWADCYALFVPRIII